MSRQIGTGIPVEYKGREQTYVKHFFLRHYLEKVAYKTLSTYDSFVYVDGFSGPWKSAGEGFSDTSFGIALEKLRQVKAGWKERKRDVNLKCVFVEKKRESCRELEAVAIRYPDLDILIIQGKFEESIQQILRFVERGFCFLFVDPTNWAVDTKKSASC